MRNLIIAAFLLLSGCSSQNSMLLLDDFEGEISSKTVDFGAGNGSSVEVKASVDTVYSGKQSLKIEYDSVAGGYMWIARGYNLDVTGAAQWLSNPSDISWPKFKTISFYLFGEASNVLVALDIKDSQKEIFRFMFKDDKQGWSKITCPLGQFFSRSDWQPDDAQANSVMDFPITSFQFEVRTPHKGAICIDKVELAK